MVEFRKPIWKMKKLIHISFLLLLALPLFGQKEKLYIKEGLQSHNDGDYEKAASLFYDALDEKGNSWEAIYNLGNNFFKQENYEKAAAEYQKASNLIEDASYKSKAFHNLGNALLMDQKIKESIEAYKDALRLNPKDDETRFNLAVAKKLLEEQENQDENQEQEDKNEDSQDENQEQEGENEEQEEGNEEQQNQGEEGEEKEDEQKEQQQMKPDKDAMSEEEAERLLRSLQNREEQTQEDVNKKRFKVEKIKIEKDW